MKKILLKMSLLSLLTLSASANDCYSFLKVSDFKKSSECYSKLIKKDNSFNNNYYLGLSFLEQGRYKEALPYFKKAEAIETNPSELIFVYNKLFITYSAIGGFSDLELIYAMKSLNYYLKTNEPKNIATAYSNLASYYENLNDYPKALEYLNKSLEYDSSDPIAYNNIANIYNNLKQFDKSEENLIIAISKAEQLGDISLLCTLKSNLGILKYFSGDYVFSQKTLLEANSICSKLNILDSVANSFVYLGFVSVKLNDFVSAKQYYNKAKPLVEQIGDKGISYDLNSLKNSLSN